MATRKEKLVQGEYYHIYNRGVDKREIFSDKADLQRFFQSMKEFNVEKPIGSLYLNTFSKNRGKLRGSASQLVSFIAFCLNPNHYHFLITPLVIHGCPMPLSGVRDGLYVPGLCPELKTRWG